MFFLVAVPLLASAFADPIPLKSHSGFPHGRIVGGEDAAIEDYPYQVALEMYGVHGCGGSIISAHYVLTAGHCVEDEPAESVTVRAGSAISLEGGSLHHVEKVIIHDKFDVNEHDVLIFDVALLRVKEPFKFDETRKPINLYEKTDIAKPGEMSVITGWGSTGSGLPIQLQTVSVPIVAKELCDKAYRRFGGLPEGQICAAYYGVGGKDSCQGDSGGPLAINRRLAGIVSWGSGCAQPYYPGVYTEVAYFRDWIDKNAEF